MSDSLLTPYELFQRKDSPNYWMRFTEAKIQQFIRWRQSYWIDGPGKGIEKREYERNGRRYFQKVKRTVPATRCKPLKQHYRQLWPRCRRPPLPTALPTLAILSLMASLMCSAISCALATDRCWLTH